MLVGHRSGRPTIVDVARAAGVAVSTVSRVVNSDPTVGADFAERVRRAIDAVGWEVDDRARGLRLGVSGTVGAAVVTLGSRFLEEVDRAARAAGLVVVASATDDDPTREDDTIRALCRRRVDGLLVEPTSPVPSPYLLGQIRHGLAVVAVDRVVAAEHCDAVVSDNRAGIRLAWEHLRRRGHETIAYLGDDERLFTGAERADAFRALAAAEGRDVRHLLSTGATSRDRVARDLAVMLERTVPPTALITGNDIVSGCVLQVLGSGLAGLGFVGFDDIEFAEIVDPPCTVIAQDYAAMGRAAVEMIVSRRQDPSLAARRRVVGVSLIDRSSRLSRPVRSRVGAGTPRRHGDPAES